MTERAVLRRLRTEFEGKGYRFVTAPTQDDLPGFLHSHRPDALAVGPNETVVIETTPKPKASGSMPTRLAEDIASHPGWRLLIVNSGQVSDEAVQLPRADRAQIGTALDEARALRARGHDRIALMAAWSVLEAVARGLREGRSASRLLSPPEVVEGLAADGWLSLEEAPRLRDMIATRNLVVHGDLSAGVPGADVDFLLNTIGKVHTTSGL